MPVSRAQAKEICTKPELELVESSFRSAVNELTPARLRSKIERARSSANQRTERKARRQAQQDLGSASR